MSRWLFVRHAQSVANAGRWFSGHTDVGLSDEGLLQARRLAPEVGGVTRAVASDLRRAWETAQIALDGREVPLHTSPALRERDMGAWTGRPIAELEPLGLHAVLYGWRTRAPEGESLLDATLRAVRWLGALPEDDTTLVVAHGGVLRGLLGVVDGLDVGEIPRRIVDNATVNLRELDAGDWARALERLEAAPHGPG